MNNYLMTIRTHFDAAHRLINLPSGHPCSNLHGHTWKVIFRFMGHRLTEQGWLADFKKVKTIIGIYIDRLDHKCINDQLPDLPPTAENLAAWFYEQIKEDGDINEMPFSLYNVTVCESDDCSITYCEGDEV